MTQEYLDQKLKSYDKTEMYPFHMPGHKRKGKGELDAFSLDITEIEGFDNLHHAQGILKEAQQRTAKLYGAEESFFLVNGSTVGILAAISATTEKGDKILMARNSHKSVYNAVFLRELTAAYLYPQITHEGIQSAITPEEVEKALEENPDAKAVLITSPTYDGVVSDIGKIAELAHGKGIPLIVDEAHGAHLGFSEGFPKSALQMGADIVIQSMHKTLPALTQSALLHIGSGRVNRENVQKYLSIYQTSSPSYVLMSSMDFCNRLLKTKGKELFEAYEMRMEEFRGEMKSLRHLRLLTKEELLRQGAYDVDMSKLLIYTGKSRISGEELSGILRERYQLELEMASAYYALAMTSIMDEEEAYRRLAKALKEIDTEMSPGHPKDVKSCMEALYGKKDVVCPVFEAEKKPKKSLLLSEAEGETAADYVYLYPPGIPVLVPGERIERELLAALEESRKKQLNLCGLLGKANERINVVIF